MNNIFFGQKLNQESVVFFVVFLLFEIFLYLELKNLRSVERNYYSCLLSWPKIYMSGGATGRARKTSRGWWTDRPRLQKPGSTSTSSAAAAPSSRPKNREDSLRKRKVNLKLYIVFFWLSDLQVKVVVSTHCLKLNATWLMTKMFIFRNTIQPIVLRDFHISFLCVWNQIVSSIKKCKCVLVFLYNFLK